MEEVLIAVAAKSLVEGFIKNYALPKLSKLAHSISKEGKAYLSLNSNAFIAYYKRAYNNYSIINTLAFKERVKKLKDIYIPLTIYPVDNKKEKKLTKIEGYPKELLDKYGRILITDTAGMGKSTLMKRMFLDVIDGQFGIPIFIELRRLNENNDILNEVAIQLGGLNDGFDKGILETLFVDGEFIFFFDGYDEISSSNKAFVTRNIQDFVAKAPNNKYILTSRPEEELACFGEFQEFRIRELKKVESYDLLRKYDISGKTSRLLISKLETGNYSMINEFLKNPLLVSLLFAAFDFKQTIPLKKHIFYRQVFDAYFDSHDLSKGDSYVHEKKSNLDLDDFDKVMRKIGYECLRKQKIEFEKDELLNIIDSAKSENIKLYYGKNLLITNYIVAGLSLAGNKAYYDTYSLEVENKEKGIEFELFTNFKNIWVLEGLDGSGFEFYFGELANTMYMHEDSTRGIRQSYMRNFIPCAEPEFSNPWTNGKLAYLDDFDSQISTDIYDICDDWDRTEYERYEKPDYTCPLFTLNYESDSTTTWEAFPISVGEYDETYLYSTGDYWTYYPKYSK